MMNSKAHPRPLNVSFRHGSPAEKVFRKRAGLPSDTAIATGVKPTPSHDLHFHGGKTIQNLHFMNLFVGADAWPAGDITNINASLAAAMSDANLNNVMEQYFPGSITSKFDGSEKIAGPAPKTMSQGDVESIISSMATQGKFSGHDLTSTVFNFMLPPGTVLNDNAGKSSSSAPEKTAAKESPIPDDDDADSLHGLGGYHGSVHTSNGETIYYAIGVYSEVLPNGTENGIVAFDKPWKNMVATFYHELNEARTDCDVEDAINAGNDPNGIKFMGWTSKQGEECGDFPIFEAGNALNKVFQEVALAKGAGTVPVQFQYSNSVHGPEGPVAKPDKKASTK